MTEANAARVLKVVGRFGFGSAGLTEETLLTPNKVIQLGRPPHRIDLLTSIDGVSFEGAWSRRIEAEIEGVSVFVISLQDLLANKKATGRPKDLGDLSKLAPGRG